jgi:hypothetical protein
LRCSPLSSRRAGRHGVIGIGTVAN